MSLVEQFTLYVVARASWRNAGFKLTDEVSGEERFCGISHAENGGDGGDDERARAGGGVEEEGEGGAGANLGQRARTPVCRPDPDPRRLLRHGPVDKSREEEWDGDGAA